MRGRRWVPRGCKTKPFRDIRSRHPELETVLSDYVPGSSNEGSALIQRSCLKSSQRSRRRPAVATETQHAARVASTKFLGADGFCALRFSDPEEMLLCA